MLLPLLTGLAAAAPTGVTAAQAALEARHAADGVHATALALAPEDGPIWTGTVGELRADQRLPLGTASGVLTGLAVLEAAARGALELDAPADRYAPGLGLADLTVRDLVDHTSGLAAVDGDRLWVMDGPLEAVAAEALARAPRGARGQPERSSLNPLVAGLVLEGALGRPYLEALDAVLLRPLALRSVGLVQPPLAPTSRMIFGWPVPATPPRAAAPALGLAASVRDLGRLGQHLLEGRTASSKALLGHGGQPWEAGFTPVDLGGVPGLHAPGDGPTSRVDLVVVPREESAVLVLSDTGGLWGLASDDRAGLEAARRILGQDPAAAPGLAGRARSVGVALLALAAMALAVALRGLRRPPRRPRAAVLATATPAVGLLAVLGWLTAANPLGAAGWAVLWVLQPDLVLGLAGLTAAWLLAAGVAAGRLRGR